MTRVNPPRHILVYIIHKSVSSFTYFFRHRKSSLYKGFQNFIRGITPAHFAQLSKQEHLPFFEKGAAFKTEDCAHILQRPVVPAYF